MVLLQTTGLPPLNHIDDEPKRVPKKANKDHHDDFLFVILLAVPFIFYAPFPVAYVLIGAVLLSFIGVLLYTFHWPRATKVMVQRAAAFKAEEVPVNLDTIVIGSGSGGSTCANLLAQSGQRVLVLEQHPTATGG